MNNIKNISLEILLKEVYDKQLIKDIIEDVTLSKFKELGEFQALNYKDLVLFDMGQMIGFNFNSFKTIKNRNERANKPEIVEKHYIVDRIGIVAKFIIDSLLNHKHSDLDEILCGTNSLSVSTGNTSRKKTLKIEGDLLDGMESQLAYITMLILAENIYNEQGYIECREWLEECLSINSTKCKGLDVDEFLMKKEVTDTINKLFKTFDI